MPLFFAKIKTIVLAMALLIGGKVAVMTAVGQAFGLTLVQSMRRSVLPQSLLPDGPERHRNLSRSGSSARFNPHTPPLPTRPCCLLRSGLLLSPGGEFAFVLFGEAVSRGIMGAALAKELYLVVALRWECRRTCMGQGHGRPCAVGRAWFGSCSASSRALPRALLTLAFVLPLLPPCHAAWRLRPSWPSLVARLARCLRRAT